MSGLPFSARALFEYEAVESTELSLTIGDCVTIEEVNESGWSLARHPTSDRVGWIPTEYIEKIDGQGHAVQGGQAGIAVERPQPQLTGSQAIDVTVDSGRQRGVSEGEEEVAELTITTSQSSTAPPSPAPPSLATLAAGAALPPPHLQSVALPSPTSYLSPSPIQPPPSSAKVCAHCQEPIKSAFVMARDLLFHPNHFLCHLCSTPLGGKPYQERDGHFHCEACYAQRFNPRCAACQEAIVGAYVSALGRTFHPHHFTCHHCQAPFPDHHFRQHDDRAYCESDYALLFAPPCHTCHQPVVGAVFEALGQKYHLGCFVCVEGGHTIGEGVMFHMHEGQVYCPEHFEKRFLHTCVACQQTIKGQYIKVGEDFYHGECWQCHACRTTLRVDTCAQLDAHFYCKACAAEVKRSQAQPLALLASNPASARPSRAASNANSPQPAAATRLSVSNSPSPLVRPIGEGGAAEVVPLTSVGEGGEGGEGGVGKGAVVVYAEPDVVGEVEYEVLKDAERRPKEVDPKRKEAYLSEAEFKRLFGVDKAAFNALPAWKQMEQKKRHALF